MTRVHVAAGAALAAALLGALLGGQAGGSLDSTLFCAVLAYAAAVTGAVLSWQVSPLHVVRATSKSALVVTVLGVLFLLSVVRAVLHVTGVA